MQHRVDALCAAIKIGDFPLVSQMILDKGGDLVFFEPDSDFAALQTASKFGHVDMVELFLSHTNVNVDWGYCPALHIACCEGHTACARVLLEHNANPNQPFGSRKVTPLYFAAQNGHFECVKCLLKYGADPEIRVAEDSTPVFIAAQNGHVDIVALLINQCHVDINRPAKVDDATPLISAIIMRKTKMGLLLISAGANLDVCSDSNGLSAFHIATLCNVMDLVQCMIDHNVNVNHCSLGGGLTALHIAARAGRIEIAKILLENNANIESTTCCGYTAIDICKKGKEKVRRMSVYCNLFRVVSKVIL